MIRMAGGYIGQHPALIKMYEDNEQSDKHVANADYPHNSMAERTIHCICLGPMGNNQGSYKFFNLAIQKKIVYGEIKVILMSKLIIQQVEHIAEAEGQPINMALEASRVDIIDFDSGPNKSDITGV